MSITRTGLALAALTLIVCAFPAMSQERMAFAGTSVSAVLPENFVPMPGGNPGYMDMSSMAGVSAMQAPTALFDQLELDTGRMERTQEDVIRQLGIEGEATSETLEAGGRQYLVVSSEMTMAGLPTTMWTVISDREASFVLSFFQASLPTGQPVLDRDAVIKVLASVEVGSPLSFDELIAQQGFRLAAAPPFEFQTVMGPIAFLHTEQDRAADLTAPEIMISRPPFSPGLPIDDIGIHELNAMGENSIRDLETVTFGGAEGKRLSGDVNRPGGTETFVMYFAYVGDAPLVFFATGRPEDMDAAMIEVVDSIAASVEGLEN